MGNGAIFTIRGTAYGSTLTGPGGTVYSGILTGTGHWSTLSGTVNESTVYWGTLAGGSAVNGALYMGAP